MSRSVFGHLLAVELLGGADQHDQREHAAGDRLHPAQRHLTRAAARGCWALVRQWTRSFSTVAGWAEPAGAVQTGSADSAARTVSPSSELSRSTRTTSPSLISPASKALASASPIEL